MSHRCSSRRARKWGTMRKIERKKTLEKRMERAWVSFGMRLTSEKKEEIHRESTFRGTRGTPLGEKGRKGTYKRLEYCLLWRGVVPKRGTEKESRGEFDRTIKGWQGSPARVPPTDFYPHLVPFREWKAHKRMKMREEVDRIGIGLFLAFLSRFSRRRHGQNLVTLSERSIAIRSIDAVSSFALCKLVT